MFYGADGWTLNFSSKDQKVELKGPDDFIFHFTLIDPQEMEDIEKLMEGKRYRIGSIGNHSVEIRKDMKWDRMILIVSQVVHETNGGLLRQNIDGRNIINRIEKSLSLYKKQQPLRESKMLEFYTGDIQWIRKACADEGLEVTPDEIKKIVEECNPEVKIQEGPGLTDAIIELVRNRHD
jgi:hypothetical protein